MSNVTQDGKSPETAYEVFDSSGEMTSGISSIVERDYGGEDGDFFILSETTMENKDDGNRYKVLYVKDFRNNNHTVYFKIA
jgi:hypothetical protein